jgi:hypothetical protein
VPEHWNHAARMNRIDLIAARRHFDQFVRHAFFERRHPRGANEIR